MNWIEFVIFNRFELRIVRNEKVNIDTKSQSKMKETSLQIEIRVLVLKCFEQ